MSGLVVPIEIVIHPEIASPERVRALIEKLRDFQPLLIEIGTVLEEGVLDWFTSQGEGSWAPLSVVTTRERFRLGYGPNNELVRTGKLIAALTQHDAPGHKFLVTGDTVTVGVYGAVVPYAEFLDGGTRRMPARALVAATARTRQRILDLIIDWLGGSDGVSVIVDAPLRKAA